MPATMRPSLPEGLDSNADDELIAKLQLARLRAQVAVVRSLVDHVEQLSRPGSSKGLTSQLVEEIARLGSRAHEAASSLRTLLDGGELGVPAADEVLAPASQ